MNPANESRAQDVGRAFPSNKIEGVPTKAPEEQSAFAEKVGKAFAYKHYTQAEWDEFNNVSKRDKGQWDDYYKNVDLCVQKNSNADILNGLRGSMTELHRNIKHNSPGNKIKREVSETIQAHWFFVDCLHKKHAKILEEMQQQHIGEKATASEDVDTCSRLTVEYYKKSWPKTGEARTNTFAKN